MEHTTIIPFWVNVSSSVMILNAVLESVCFDKPSGFRRTIVGDERKRGGIQQAGISMVGADLKKLRLPFERVDKPPPQQLHGACERRLR